MSELIVTKEEQLLKKREEYMEGQTKQVGIPPIG